MRTPNSRAATTAPSTSARGAWSPPIASTAMVIIKCSGGVPCGRRDPPGVRPRCPRLPAPYNSRSAGILGEAVSFHDNLGTWRGREWSGSRAGGAYSFGHVSAVVLGWAYKLLLFTPDRRGHSMVFPA